jgi:sucrose-6-phosphate hydrolase SacC (GH32 family)
MSNWTYANDVPTSPWRSGMTVPRELSLRDTPAGYRLVQRPVRELAALRGTPARIRGVTIEQAGAWLSGKSFPTGLAELEIELDRLPSKGEVWLAVRHGETEETRVDLVLGGGFLRVDRTRSGRKDFSKAFTTAHTAPLRIVNGKASLRLLVDRSSIEVLAQGGETAMTELIFPATTGIGFGLGSEGQARGIRVRGLTVWPLRSAPPKISEVR